MKAYVIYLFLIATADALKFIKSEYIDLDIILSTHFLSSSVRILSKIKTRAIFKQ